MMTPEALVARAMLAAVKRKGGIARKLEFSGRAGAPDYLVAVNNRIAFIELKSDRGKLSDIQRAEFSTLAKYGIKPIFVAFGADNARTIIDNMASDDWTSFCEVNQWR